MHRSEAANVELNVNSDIIVNAVVTCKCQNGDFLQAAVGQRMFCTYIEGFTHIRMTQQKIWTGRLVLQGE